MGKKLPKEIKEMNVNYVDVDDMVSVTAYERKMIKQLLNLAENYPEEVRVVAVNEDGTTVVHLPKKFVHINFGKRAKREMTEDERAAAAERLKVARQKKAEMNERFE